MTGGARFVIFQFGLLHGFMSTIVIVKKGGEAAIAADTQTTSGGTKIFAGLKTRKEKILRFQDTYLGFVGYSVHQSVFQSVMEKHPGELSFRSQRHIFETFLALHPILKEKFYVNPKEDDDSGAYESSQMNIVLANPHGIFSVSPDRHVMEVEKFWATGSGSEYALGAMWQAYESTATAQEIAIAGVRAASEFDLYSSLPYTVHTVSLRVSAANGAGESCVVDLPAMRAA